MSKVYLQGRCKRDGHCKGQGRFHREAPSFSNFVHEQILRMQGQRVVTKLRIPRSFSEAGYFI